MKWKAGFEVELIAPAGKTRQDLAIAISAQQSHNVQHSHNVQRIFYPQSEPGKSPGIAVFENLVLGFDVTDSDGSMIARCVDDLTIRSGLDFHAASKPDWYRIISDDIRFLELVMGHCDAKKPRRDVLTPLSALFATKLDTGEKGMSKVVDTKGRSIAIAAPLPGERERVCEIITPPYVNDHRNKLVQLLKCAGDLGFTVPKEAAVHVHFDAGRLKNARVFCRMVEIFALYGSALKGLVKSNPHCTRVGDVPFELVKQCREPGFAKIGWKPARRKLQELGLSKYCDFNFFNMVHDVSGKDTFEVRILPGSMDADAIINHAGMFEKLFVWCCDASPDICVPDTFEQMLASAGVNKKSIR